MVTSGPCLRCHRDPPSTLCPNLCEQVVIGYSPSHSTTAPVINNTYTMNNSALCPDLLRLEDIGVADGWRGKVVRGFFKLLKIVTGV